MTDPHHLDFECRRTVKVGDKHRIRIRPVGNGEPAELEDFDSISVVAKSPDHSETVIPATVIQDRAVFDWIPTRAGQWTFILCGHYNGDHEHFSAVSVVVLEEDA